MWRKCLAEQFPGMEFLSYVFRQENYFPESGVLNER